MIDIKSASEAYNDEIINRKICIRRQFKLVDVITKGSDKQRSNGSIAEEKIHYEIDNSIIENTNDSAP